MTATQQEMGRNAPEAAEEAAAPCGAPPRSREGEARTGASANNQTTSAKIRIGTPVPFEWVGLEWYVACVRQGRDYRARDLLEAAGLPVFMMERRVAVRRGKRLGNGNGGRREMTDMPLWAGYLFVAGDVSRVEAEVVAWGMDGRVHPVFGFLGHDGCRQRVNGAAMQALFVAHEQGRFVPRTRRDALRRRFVPGQEVAITDGPFAFVEGIVNSFRNGDDVEILAELFGRETPITVPLDSLRSIGS